MLARFVDYVEAAYLGRWLDIPTLEYGWLHGLVGTTYLETRPSSPST